MCLAPKGRILSTKMFVLKIWLWTHPEDVTRAKPCMISESSGQYQVLPIDERPHPLGLVEREPHADRATPSLSHEREVVESQLSDKLGHDVGVFPGRVAVLIWVRRQSKTRVVDGDAPEAFPQANDNAPVQEAPGRVTVQKEDRRSGALVDVVNLPDAALQPT